MCVTVTRQDITAAVKALGVTSGDIMVVHSSYKSMGTVVGGPDAVISGLEDALGKEGTLVMPTLCQVDFENRRKTWYMDKPSDVGFLTEYFRKQPYVYRSNHPSHSVAARGRRAYELTCEHGAYGPHLCPYGTDTFADSSPWAKLYRLDGKILLLGCGSRPNTMKHFVESLYSEEVLYAVKDPAKQALLKARLISEENGGQGIFPMYHAHIMQDELEKLGFVQSTVCGNAQLSCMSAKTYVDQALDQLRSRPEFWFTPPRLEWILDCQRQAGIL